MRLFLVDICLSEHDTFRQNDNNNCEFGMRGKLVFGWLNKQKWALASIKPTTICAAAFII